MRPTHQDSEGRHSHLGSSTSSGQFKWRGNWGPLVEKGSQAGRVAFFVSYSLSPGCVKHLMLDNESHADRNDHCFLASLNCMPS